MKMRKPTKWEKLGGPMHHVDRDGIVPLDRFGIESIPQTDPKFPPIDDTQKVVDDYQ